jgi:hypothetical protein
MRRLLIAVTLLLALGGLALADGTPGPIPKGPAPIAGSR